jgi:chorismate dehydratase
VEQRVKFGSINYLNLLPFQVFMKKRIGSTQFKQMLRYKRAVPSMVNEAFMKGRIDAAFISSVLSQRRECSDLGIVADGPVYSVLLIPGEEKRDHESATSNMLAEVLKLRGEVLIGDKALKYYLEGGEGIDLSSEWKRRTGLPFVFARLCCRHRDRRIAGLAKEFSVRRWKIPYYILKRAARKRDIGLEEARWYLGHIDYRLGWRERKALKKFLKMSKKVKKGV